MNEFENEDVGDLGYRPKAKKDIALNTDDKVVLLLDELVEGQYKMVLQINRTNWRLSFYSALVVIAMLLFGLQ